MGYRSDVKAAFYVDKEEDFGTLKVWLMANFPMEYFRESVRWFDKGMVFEVNDVKWYDEYREVKAFDALVTAFRRLISDNPDLRLGYEYARIGEEYTDIETDGDGKQAWLLSVERNICIEV